MQERAEEGVKVVGRGREVEPSWVQKGLDVVVESGHGGDDLGVGQECCAEDTNGRGGEGDFDGVVDV